MNLAYFGPFFDTLSLISKFDISSQVIFMIFIIISLYLKNEYSC